MKQLTLKEIAVDHDYYCSDNNYYSNEASLRYETFSEFIDEFKDADVDMNLVFRWDVKRNDNNTYYLEVFMIKQRKGIFTPIMVESMKDEDVQDLVDYLKPHQEKLKQIWTPLSF